MHITSEKCFNSQGHATILLHFMWKKNKPKPKKKLASNGSQSEDFRTDYCSFKALQKYLKLAAADQTKIYKNKKILCFFKEKLKKYVFQKPKKKKEWMNNV